MTAPGLDPRELTAGYSHAFGKGTAAYRGVLRDGSYPLWTCRHTPPHIMPTLAKQCAEAEKERRIQGARAVAWVLHCGPCGIFWEIRGDSPADISEFVLSGRCPRCTGATVRTRIAVLEREEPSVR